MILAHSKFIQMRYLILFVCLSISCFSCQKQSSSIVKISTDLGDIQLQVFTEEAPITANNFLMLVDQGLYTSSYFYRVVRLDNQPVNPVKIEVIQGGLKVDSLVDQIRPIIHENTEMTGIKHLDGIISMARNNPGTASSEFFICVGNQPELDFEGKRNPDGQGFAAFGKVIQGMDVVREIQSLEDKGQMLKEDVLIKEITRMN